MKKVTKVKTHWNEAWALIETKAETKTCNYYVSNYGNLKSVHKESKDEKMLKGSTLKSGHKRLCITLKGNVREAPLVHLLVGKYFLKEKKGKQEFLIHVDQNKENNHYKNLKWLTREELNARWQELEIYRDVVFNTKKMTESKVLLLKRRLKKGKTKEKILAKQFNISVTQVRRIASGENWGNVNL